MDLLNLNTFYLLKCKPKYSHPDGWNELNRVRSVQKRKKTWNEEVKHGSKISFKAK